MSDLIDRQAVLNMASTIQTDDSSGNEILDVVEVDDIKALPSAQPEQRWIPCSERLPEEMAVVLVYTSVDGYFTAYFDGICWYHAGLHMMRIYSDVVAWMPLPEPYRPEGSRDENKT